MKISPNEFAMACYLVLMENGEGVVDKHPSYIKEKNYMLFSGYDAFGALDLPNMRKVIQWCNRWGVEIPDIIQQEIDMQDEAERDLIDKGIIL